MRFYTGRPWSLRQRIGIAIIAAFQLWISVAALPADAITQEERENGYLLLGCRYNPSTINPISYRLDNTHHVFANAFRSGVNKWNRTSAPGRFGQAYGSSSSNPQIRVTSFYTYYPPVAYSRSLPVRHAARVNNNPCYPNRRRDWPNNRVEIEFNRNYQNRFNSREWAAIAAHELGHAYGLAHVGVCTIMAWDIAMLFRERCAAAPYSLYDPTWWDIQGVHEIYSSRY